MSLANNSALLRRRDDLVAKIAIERSAIGRDADALRGLFRVADRVSAIAHYIKRHPEALLLPVIVSVVAHPWRLLGMAGSGIGLWRLAKAWRRQRIL